MQLREKFVAACPEADGLPHDVENLWRRRAGERRREQREKARLLAIERKPREQRSGAEQKPFVGDFEISPQPPRAPRREPSLQIVKPQRHIPSQTESKRR